MDIVQQELGPVTHLSWVTVTSHRHGSHLVPDDHIKTKRQDTTQRSNEIIIRHVVLVMTTALFCGRGRGSGGQPHAQETAHTPYVVLSQSIGWVHWREGNRVTPKFTLQMCEQAIGRSM